MSNIILYIDGKLAILYQRICINLNNYNSIIKIMFCLKKYMNVIKY